MNTHTDYLTRILTSAVYDVAIETPLDYAHNLSDRLHNHIWIKREDLQPVFSFKIRGAYNKMAKLNAAQLQRCNYCFSRQSRSRRGFICTKTGL